MKNLSKFVFILVLVLFAGGAAFLATWNIPAPKSKIVKVLADDRFPR